MTRRTASSQPDPAGAFSYYLSATPFFLVPLLLWLLYASRRWGGEHERPLRRSIVFFCVTLAIGPGIVVNSILKAELVAPGRRKSSSSAVTRPLHLRSSSPTSV